MENPKSGFFNKPIVKVIIKVLRFLLLQSEGKKKKKDDCNDDGTKDN